MMMYVEQTYLSKILLTVSIIYMCVMTIFMHFDYQTNLYNKKALILFSRRRFHNRFKFWHKRLAKRRFVRIRPILAKLLALGACRLRINRSVSRTKVNHPMLLAFSTDLITMEPTGYESAPSQHLFTWVGKRERTNYGQSESSIQIQISIKMIVSSHWL